MVCTDGRIRVADSYGYYSELGFVEEEQSLTPWTYSIFRVNLRKADRVHDCPVHP